MMRSFVFFAAANLVLASASGARADEGMWTFDNFPSATVEKRYGFSPSQTWLDHARLSSVRLARGCSASFVSPNGLVQTNHHCAESCIEQLSTKEKNYVATGFYAAEPKDEVRCPNVEANQLIGISDVTARVKAALEGKEGEAFSDAKKAVEAAIAKECTGGDEAFRCDVVSLYDGGIYNLYKYRRFQDVRLVFAPEKDIAFFGGDPDNFEFPRYDLDVSYFRVYDKDKPADTSANFFPYAKSDAKPDELVFVSGHPGSTDRLSTVAQLEFTRNVSLPKSLISGSELRGILTQFSTESPEHARIAVGRLFGLENGLKAQKGAYEALIDPTIIRTHAEAESTLRAKVDADPDLKKEAGGAWDEIAALLSTFKTKRDRYSFLEGRQGFSSQLFGYALALVRYPAEKAKPDEKRLPEYTDANFPITRQALVSRAPIYPEMEKLTLTFSLTKLREVLGPDDPFVKKVLGSKSPSQLAAELVDGSKLADASVREELLKGGQAAIDASTDPMIQLAKAVDPDFRAIRKDVEDTIFSPLQKNEAAIARARFKILGTSVYPDATFTLRLSYGAVNGYQDKGKAIEPVTKIGGLFARATGAEPFKLPESWIKAQASLNPDQPMNFVTTNDIIGGNSGSPIINKDGEIVGLIFDGNRYSLGGRYGYDQSVNRAIGVNVGAIKAALDKVYHADRLVRELGIE